MFAWMFRRNESYLLQHHWTISGWEQKHFLCQRLGVWLRCLLPSICFSSAENNYSCSFLISTLQTKYLLFDLSNVKLHCEFHCTNTHCGSNSAHNFVGSFTTNSRFQTIVQMPVPQQKQDFNNVPVVLVIEDPLFGTTEFPFDNPGFEAIHNVNSHSSKCAQAGENFNILSDGHIH